MILNLAPLRSYHLDTLSSLNVSSRAKRIEVREIENEVVFKQQPKKPSVSIPGTALQRQPLRPLAHAHNTHIKATTQAGDKKPKAFSVYTDPSRKAVPRSSNGTSNARTSNGSSKRPSDSLHTVRPVKMVKTHPIGSRTGTEMSAAKIEELIERKVSEALANRALDQPATHPPSEISEAVQRRLEALERKIENGETEEARAEGLRFLLMAKQHKERGEDASALKMYELAVPYFPAQEKLTKKIDSLRAKIQARRLEAISNTAEAPEADRLEVLAPESIPAPVAPLDEPAPQPKRQKSEQKIEDDHDYNGSVVMEDENDETFTYKTSKPKKSKSKTRTKSTLQVFADEADIAEPPTPRTRHLLDIINSRDVTLIKGLSGVGPKKARDLVEFLELQNDDDGGNLASLAQLRAVPGLGGRTVERAYEGITAMLLV